MGLLLALSFLGNLIVVLFILLCASMILIILVQKGRGGGLGAAFGGGGAGSLLGTKTGDFLTWVTIALATGFLVLAVLMGKFMRPSASSSTLSSPIPAATSQPVSDETDQSAADMGSDELETSEQVVLEEVTDRAETAAEQMPEMDDPGIAEGSEPAEEPVEKTE